VKGIAQDDNFPLFLVRKGVIEVVLQVKLERIANGIKAYEMAALVSYNSNLWLQVEKGLRKPPENVANKASHILGKPVEELFCPTG
jgi:transcriptional regulator with XRE-family HTH domain